MCKILNDHSAQNLKELLTRRNFLLTTYDLRNSQNDMALPKPGREFLKKPFIAVLNFGTISRLKLRKLSQFALSKI